MLYGEKFSPSEEKSGFARIIEQTYKPPNKRKDVDEYKYVEKLSSVETGIYIEPQSKEIIACFRGSITKEDWLISDAYIALAPFAFRQSARYKRSKAEVDKAMKAYSNYDVILIGHSLGGHIATVMWNEINNIDDDTRFVVYNRGSSPVEIFTKQPVNYKQRHHYHIKGDWISDPFMRDQKTKHILVKPKSKNLHGYVNFL